MPSIRPEDKILSPVYTRLNKTARIDEGDWNHCGPLAVAVLTGKPYKEVAKAFETLTNRKKRKGTRPDFIRDVLDHFGYRLKRLNIDDVLASYPARWVGAFKFVTSHHPDRIPAFWKNGKSYLALTSKARHAFAIVDGVNHDWTKARSLRVAYLFLVTKKSK